MGAFIDSSVLVAYYNKRDVHHARAVELIKKCIEGEFGEVYASDYVFDEVVTVTLVRAGLERAVEIGEYLLNSEIALLRVDEDAFRDAWKKFKSLGISFTDCTNVAMMELHGIDRILTFDEGFKRAKVKVVP